MTARENIPMMPAPSLRLMTFGLIVAAASIAACGESDEHRRLLETFTDEFIAITPGTGQFPPSFQQGSEQPAESPVHEVVLPGRFAIAKYETPQNLYEAVMGANPSRWKGPRNSAESMTWNEANEFCRRVTTRLRALNLLAQDEQIRLPSESEWEYCCRAGTTSSYSFGDSAQAPGDVSPRATRLDEYAWHTGNAAGNDPAVGSLKPNAWGLHDIHGYLWEFCCDDWHPDYHGAPADGSPWRAAAPPRTGTDHPLRVLRGGSWKEDFRSLRSSSRRAVGTTVRDDAIGFRCVRARMNPAPRP